MKKILICLIIIIALIINLPITLGSEEGITSLDHVITISKKDNYLLINEKITIQGVTNESYDTLSVWIQNGAYDINLQVNSNIPESKVEEGNIFIYNISSLGILKKDKTEVLLSYNIEKNKDFTKTVLRDTDSISIKFDGTDIFTGTDLVTGSSLQFQLYEPPEPTLDWYITVLIILLIVIVALLTLYTFKKQKTIKIKDTTTIGASEELLSTKKTLLMELLKDIEKQHRMNKISDETYNKLKEKYKQEAVEAMKQLEDIKSKVK